MECEILVLDIQATIFDRVDSTEAFFLGRSVVILGFAECT